MYIFIYVSLKDRTFFLFKLVEWKVWKKKIISYKYIVVQRDNLETGARHCGQVLLRINQAVKQSKQKTCPHVVVVGCRPIKWLWHMEHFKLALELLIKLKEKIREKYRFIYFVDCFTLLNLRCIGEKWLKTGIIFFDYLEINFCTKKVFKTEKSMLFHFKRFFFFKKIINLTDCCDHSRFQRKQASAALCLDQKLSLRSCLLRNG